MAVLDKIFSIIKNAITDWRLGFISLCGFVATFIIVKENACLIGVVVSFSIVAINL